MKFIAHISIALTALLLSGCLGPGLTPQSQHPIVNYPTDPMVKVVEDINANNLKIGTLWAHHYYEADVVDDKHQNHHVAGDGTILYKSPLSMRLRGNAAVVGNVFDIGSNPETFWLTLGPEAGDTMWWGKYRDFAQIDPDSTGIPIRPDMVLDVLGITPISTNFSELPAPIMRYNVQNDSYVFIWIGKLPGRWVAMREVWYDRQTKLPKFIYLYDMNGRAVLQGELSKYRQVQVDGLARAQWPWMAGVYKLSFPESGSRLAFALDQSMLSHRDPELGGSSPNPRSFRMPNPERPGVTRVVQVGGGANAER